jgi:hypothetical protein
MPECDEHGKALDEQAIFKSVRGYAAAVASTTIAAAAILNPKP